MMNRVYGVLSTLTYLIAASANGQTLDFNHGTFWLPREVQEDLLNDHFFQQEFGLKSESYETPDGRKIATDFFGRTTYFQSGTASLDEVTSSKTRLLLSLGFFVSTESAPYDYLLVRRAIRGALGKMAEIKESTWSFSIPSLPGPVPWYHTFSWGWPQSTFGEREAGFSFIQLNKDYFRNRYPSQPQYHGRLDRLTYNSTFYPKKLAADVLEFRVAVTPKQRAFWVNFCRQLGLPTKSSHTQAQINFGGTVWTLVNPSSVLDPGLKKMTFSLNTTAPRTYQRPLGKNCKFSMIQNQRVASFECDAVPLERDLESVKSKITALNFEEALASFAEARRPHDFSQAPPRLRGLSKRADQF